MLLSFCWGCDAVLFSFFIFFDEQSKNELMTHGHVCIAWEALPSTSRFSLPMKRMRKLVTDDLSLLSWSFVI